MDDQDNSTEIAPHQVRDNILLLDQKLQNMRDKLNEKLSNSEHVEQLSSVVEELDTAISSISELVELASNNEISDDFFRNKTIQQFNDIVLNKLDELGEKLQELS